jgi:hypothetical protein
MAKRPAPRTEPRAPSIEKSAAPAAYGPVEIDRDLARMIKFAEKQFSGADANTWMDFANRAERMRTLARETMTKAEKRAVR